MNSKTKEDILTKIEDISSAVRDNKPDKIWYAITILKFTIEQQTDEMKEQGIKVR